MMAPVNLDGKPKPVINNVRSAKVIKVIEIVALKGEGVKGDPVRLVTQYWSLDGTLLAEDDKWEGEE